MIPDLQQTPKAPEGETPQAAESGNASNPSPRPDTVPAGNQLLGEKAEKYLREVANIEDVPDAQEQLDMDKTIDQVRNESSD
jgi:hypothetical protein